MKRNAAFVKLTHWEHWPAFTYYMPLLPLFLVRSLKARHPIYFTVTNPGVLYSGNGTESKFKTLELVPEKYRPKGFLFCKNDSLERLENRLSEAKIEFPLIAKPDIGFRGYMVKKIKNLDHLKKYLTLLNENTIIQEFIPYQKEIGVFYYRFPDKKKGSVSSVTIKKFIRVTGDGKQTLAELIQKDERAFLYKNLFTILHRDKIDKVLDRGQEMILSVIGNHSKGTQFINGNHLINNNLKDFMDGICQHIQGWNYGRLDIKYKDYSSLMNGTDFKILEVNGIISEPTHIYDATDENASFLNALKSINKHWDIMGKIAVQVHNEQNVPYPSVGAYLKNILWLRSYSKKLKKLNSIDL
ncbi:ATP-grasp domain-containing protein [Lutimonas zeaxanthinifaciens]|uniref:ATP-grasp domain-containing protein n=1 Tax=Lutimonas zeaxanthinifaciens TaxID=3060215 RepID=UPI00265D29D1|nr:ATP-grasp domain-containing protein [Lutimonas sp. YSD2104]WKK65043.1 ATP-grasp domain-containing protein [Lutimonas sp. YSD2104]